MGCCQSIPTDSESEEDFVATVKPAYNRYPNWNIEQQLAETQKIDKSSAKNIVNLFENQNTIPFICRYRRDLIGGNITPDKLRDIKNAYTDLVDLRKRAETIARQLEGEVNINDEVREQILCAKTMKELEFLHGIYKPANKVVQLQGLKVYAYRLLTGDSPLVELKSVVDLRNPDLDTTEKVKDALCQLVSLQISKNSEVIDELRRLQKVNHIVLKSTETSATSDGNCSDQSKYEQYFNFELDVRHIKPHQILAINRGERSNFLTVQIIVPTNFKNSIKSYIRRLFMCDGIKYSLRNQIFEQAFEECYTQRLVPFVCTQVRDDLTETAKKAGIEVFAKNLKQLLLMPPLKGKRILGIDPGFKHGCKLALISETAVLLDVGVLYPHSKKTDDEKCGFKLAHMLNRHRCNIIALGNGKACRETEAWLTKLFEKRILDPDYVQYIIVSEQGASVYSCSKEATQEFPKLDVKLISAVSIARRLNDPLSEYVKIEPRHLGIGMYQHDMDKELLSKSLDEVVSECVSYVGVDINTASLSLLKHIAGLNEQCAEIIIAHRQRNGPFRSRKDLLHVRSVDKNVLVQCAGFIRIEPKSIGGKVDNPLDCTWVHPESYKVATKIIMQCNLRLNDIGQAEFISRIKSFADLYPLDTLANHFGIPSARLQTVLEALQRQLFQDYRPEFDMQLFKKDIIRIEDLFIGEIVTGQVRNNLAFGAFVDIGLKFDGLIHKTKMNGIKLNVNDRVSASVIDLDIPRRRISLRLDAVIRL